MLHRCQNSRYHHPHQHLLHLLVVENSSDLLLLLVVVAGDLHLEGLVWLE